MVQGFGFRVEGLGCTTGKPLQGLGLRALRVAGAGLWVSRPRVCGLGRRPFGSRAGSGLFTGLSIGCHDKGVRVVFWPS